MPAGEGFELSYSSGSWSDWKQRCHILSLHTVIHLSLSLGCITARRAMSGEDYSSLYKLLISFHQGKSIYRKHGLVSVAFLGEYQFAAGSAGEVDVI